jgi:hypothetical protein
MAAVRNAQSIHKSYPGLCTQHVDNSVERLGRTRGESVGNTGTAGKGSQDPLGRPRFRHSDCAQESGAELGE